jgi:hypothetical protein
MKAACFTALIAICLFAARPASAETIRAYHIGNSLTDNIHYGGVKTMASSGGDAYKYGKHVSPGAPLDLTWALKSKTGVSYSVSPYGLYNNALKNYTWEVLTLEPFDNQIKGSTGDLQMSKNFINYTIRKSPNVQTYIYSRWPRRPTDSSGHFKPFDFTKLWTTPYTGSTQRYDLSAERKGYFESLVKSINSAEPNLRKKVKIIPVGDVLAELDHRIKSHDITGISNITQLYSDALHLNNTGAYVAGLTFYATMFKQSPVGQPVPSSYGSGITHTLAGELQDAVWDVVRIHPYAGVNRSQLAPAPGVVVPEPMAAGILLLLPLVRRRIRR